MGAYQHEHRQLFDLPGQRRLDVERGFREMFGLTPKVMMTAMRLSGARRALRHPDPTITVSAVALRWGFVEFGRFSARYRQRYGETPSETLRKARGGLSRPGDD